MSERDNRFLMSLGKELQKYVDNTVDVLNSQKEHYQTKVKRQDVLRACVRYTKEKNPEFSSGYGRWVSTKDSDKSNESE